MLCDIIREQSRFTWKTLETAHTLGCSIGEESITDFLVLEIAKGATSGGYFVKAFTKPQEALNGADWEIWLTGPSAAWFGLRIQAKKIKVSALNYPHLHPTPGVGLPTQAQKLTSAAALVGAVPIYALYNSWPSTPSAPIWNCGTYVPDKRLWGISAVAASTIASLAPTNSLASVSPYMIPFQCFFCCAAYGGSDLPTRVHAFTRSRIEGEAQLLEAPPGHVLRLLERGGEPTLEDNELDLPSGLGRVVVITDAAAG